MFLFTKLENWRTVNFLPKCIRLHQTVSQILKFSQGDTQTPISGEGTPLPRALLRSALRASFGQLSIIPLPVFTARCTLVQSAVLRSHVVCLSVRPSVTLVNCDHIGWNSSKIISPLVSLGRSLFVTPTRRVCSKGNTPKFLPE